MLLFCLWLGWLAYCDSSPLFLPISHLGFWIQRTSLKEEGLQGQTHYLPAWFLCTQVRYSCTSSGDPRIRGTRWWMASGFTSNTGWVPVVAKPPACSMMKATGLHSYRSRSCRERVRQVQVAPNLKPVPEAGLRILPLDFCLVSAVSSSPSIEGLPKI